jgi:hypothetical protein
LFINNINLVLSQIITISRDIMITYQKWNQIQGESSHIWVFSSFFFFSKTFWHLFICNLIQSCDSNLLVTKVGLGLPLRNKILLFFNINIYQSILPIKASPECSWYNCWKQTSASSCTSFTAENDYSLAKTSLTTIYLKNASRNFIRNLEKNLTG